MHYLNLHLSMRRLPLRFVIMLVTTALLIVGLLPLTTGPAFALQETPTVRVVLFYSPTCGHCHIVMNDVLPPLKTKYGSQLDIFEINAATPEGRELFLAAVEKYNPISRGVPLMIVNDTIMIGSVQIPEMLPGLIEEGLSQRGYDWPAIPGLETAVAERDPAPVQDNDASSLEQESTGEEAAQSQPPAQEPTPASTEGNLALTGSGAEGQPASVQPSPVQDEASARPLWLAKFLTDPLGNGIAVVVLLGMLASVVVVGFTFLKTEDVKQVTGLAGFSWPNWVVPVTCLLGLFVAGYMSIVEITNSDAFCGPIGDCNTVQQSLYATLWGVLPVGVFGILGYAGILAAWLMQRFIPSRKVNQFATLAMWGMALVGTLFSIYLTFLEPFVIGATCAWCITSAILITLLLWATTRPALAALEG
jgi:uncharacterized membrane protein/thiol-disulfide isomerase/thioredoxin